MWKNIIIYLTEVRERIPSVMAWMNRRRNPSDSIGNSANPENSTEPKQGIPRRGALMAAGAAAATVVLDACAGEKKAEDQASSQSNETSSNETSSNERPTFEQANKHNGEWEKVDETIASLDKLDALEAELKKDEEILRNNGREPDLDKDIVRRRVEIKKSGRATVINFTKANSAIEYPQKFTDEYGIPTVSLTGDIGLELIQEQVAQAFLQLSNMFDIALQSSNSIDKNTALRIQVAFMKYMFINSGDAANEFIHKVDPDISSARNNGTPVRPYDVTIVSDQIWANFGAIPGLPGVLVVSSNNLSEQSGSTEGSKDERKVLVPVSAKLDNVTIPVTLDGIEAVAMDREFSYLPNSNKLTTDGQGTFYRVTLAYNYPWIEIASVEVVDLSNDTILIDGLNEKIESVFIESQERISNS